MDASQAFLNREPIQNASFMHNDYVRVVKGQYIGQKGSLVSIDNKLLPEPRYLLETEKIGDVYVLQSEIELIARDG